jgi:hypothetical protein
VIFKLEETSKDHIIYRLIYLSFLNANKLNNR